MKGQQEEVTYIELPENPHLGPIKTVSGIPLQTHIVHLKFESPENRIQ